MSGLLVAIVLVLASYRITRFLIEDELFDTPRDWLYLKLKGRPALTYMLSCYWCLGFWVSVLVVGLYLSVPYIAPWILAPFAISALVGLIDQKVR